MLRVRTITLAENDALDRENGPSYGFFVVEGGLWREVYVGESSAPQLLGRGAVVLAAPPPHELLSPASRIVAMTPVRLALLDRRFLAAAARWPEVLRVLQGRLADQERDLAMQAAIFALSRVDERLWFLLWHLAEDWARVTPDGMRLELSLTHETLGRFVGARRPTVSLAVSALRERGLLRREDDGYWVLLGDAPELSDVVDDDPPDLRPRVHIARWRGHRSRARTGARTQGEQARARRFERGA